MPNDASLPISVKGVLGPPGQVVLLRNERAEWELPGGRLEVGDTTLETALEREVLEELGLEIAVGDIVGAWRYEPVPNRHVLVVTYTCSLIGPWPTRLRHSAEHNAVGVFDVAELDELALPQGYRRAIVATMR